MKVGYRKSLDGYLVCVFLKEGERPPKELVPRSVKQHFQGKPGQTFSVDTDKRRVLLVGLGKKKEFRLDNLRGVAGAAARYAEKIKEKEFTVYAPDTDDESAQAITEGAMLAAYKFDRYKTKREDIFTVKRMHLVAKRDVSGGIRRGMVLADAQNYARELGETPANMATPQSIAQEARKFAKEKGIAVTVYDRNAMRKMGMNAILAVARGSAQPPVLVKLEYNKGKRYPLYCVVGKGVTFDSGGISLKPSKDMHAMKYDKCGAINVLGVFKAVAGLKLPVRLLGLMPLTENVPGGNAQKPGDIVKAYDGKTIEVLNTDAEGRMILADVLGYAAEQKPEYLIDMATLTGAMIVSLGRHAIGMFTDDDKLAKVMEKAGEETHERVWRMPLWPEYSEMMKSDIADLKNISELPEAGSITAAVFLKEFTGDRRWVHLDIAAVERVKWNHMYFSNGATGIGVRLVTRALERLSKEKS